MLSDLSRPLKGYKQSAEAERAEGAKKAQAAETVAPASQAGAEPAEGASSESAGEADLDAGNTASEAATPTPPPAPPSTPAPAPARENRRAAKASRAAQAAVEVGDIASDNDAKKALRQCQDVARKVSAFWLGNKLDDPRPYRIARTACWMLIEQTPPDNDGVTQIMPPQAERVKFFDALQAKSEFAELVVELEKTLARAPFWLSGQYRVVTALRGLGPQCDKAVKTVVAETRHFLKRLPAVIDLSFSDQTPFADDATRLWLETEVLAGEGDDAPGAGGGQAPAPWDAALGEARKLAAAGDIAAAQALFSEGIASAGEQRARFYWRCALADFLLQTGHAEAAIGVLRPMADQAENYRLDDWEPVLLGRIYHLLYQSYRKQQSRDQDDETLQALIDSSYERLCWFDPVAALTAKGET